MTYSSLISSHPVVIIIAVAVFSVSCIIISLTTIKLPNFSDPQLGFEARGTVISNRLTAWQNLLDSTGPSGLLTTNPLEDLKQSTHHQVFHSKLFSKTKEKEDFANKLTNSFSSSSLDKLLVPDRETDYYNTKNVTIVVVDDGFHNLSRQINIDRWKTLKELNVGDRFADEEDEEELEEHFHDDHDHLSEDGFFCGSGPGSEYSRVVVSSEAGSLMSHDKLLAVCRLQLRLTEGVASYAHVCENARRGRCCPPWSLPNYIAMLHKRTSCLQITEEDVRQTQELLENCSHLYYNLHLSPDTVHKDVSAACQRHNAVYNLMHYILDSAFLPPKVNESGELLNTMIFLPMARSSAVLDYYHSLDIGGLNEGDVYISAIDFGLKNALFDESLVRDTWLIALGAAFVLGCMWLYTGSLFLTTMTIAAIAFSLGIAYFIYTVVFNLRFFPFMNLLASIVAVGIGADDAFIMSKVWQTAKVSHNYSLSPTQLVHSTLKHSALSMFVTTVTTAAAFFSSYVSAITAVRCFSVFAGLAVIVNYVLMVTWLPACIVLSERNCRTPRLSLPPLQLSLADSVFSMLNDLLIISVVGLKYVWLCLLTAVAVASVFVVFFWPKLRLPDSADFQLFTSNHPFERYDGVYKRKFYFEKTQVDTGDNSAVEMPLRFVWGVLPEDGGDFMDPASRGRLRLDHRFDVAAPDSQAWLINFCRSLRSQPFFEPTFGSLYPNCFIESFVDWMNRRCQDPIDRKSRTPCCESARFPYPRHIFNLCLARAIADLHLTPRQLITPGIAGPRFARGNPNLKKPPKVRAVVVEYDSNTIHSTSYAEMDIFFKKVEAWSEREMSGAPVGMRSGFFVSQLAFYDLQRTLARDTLLAIAVSLAVSLVVLMTVTLNVLVSLYTILSITCIIFVTVAFLVLIGWKLNVLESVAVSVAIGLAVDFSLHYAVNYRMCPENGSRESCVAHALQIMSGPSLMAALTTAAAGALMLPSSVLAYIQIGVFLVVVMVVSWLYSTYFLMCLLAVAGPERNFGQLSYPELGGLLKKRGCDENSCPGSDKTVYVNVLSESTLSTASTMCGREAHEMDALARHSCRPSRRLRRSGSLSQSSSRKVSLPADQSPSATSATTVIHDDLLDLTPLASNHVA